MLGALAVAGLHFGAKGTTRMDEGDEREVSCLGLITSGVQYA